MKTFKQYLTSLSEGGAIKIGDTKAEPISTKNRKATSEDVHRMLSDLHDSFHAATGKHLFGADKKALKTGSAYSGSSAHLNNKDISDEEFHKTKPTMGDVDSQVPKEHMKDLHSHLQAGKNFGKYTVVGTKKHGAEVSALMRHDNGEHHQIDFEGVDYHKEEPTKFESFAHSSPWEDNKAGIKGAAHKIIISAAGGDHHKFSITHGLRSRTDEKDPGVKDPEGISKSLFGEGADHSKIHSFHGVTDLIKKHIPLDQHQAITDKFRSGIEQRGKSDSSEKAMAHLTKNLGTK